VSGRGVLLLTGGAGGVGSALIPILEEAGWTVRALSHVRPVPRASEQISGDLGDAASLVVACRGARAVLHMAAVTHARRGSAYQRVNVGGTRQLCVAAREAGMARFVLVSSRSAAVDGGSYSLSKLRAEDEVRNSGTPFVIVRLPELYAGDGKEGTEVIRRQAARGRPIPIVSDGGDEICPVHRDDVLDPLRLALESADTPGRTYTLGGECTSVRAYAEACIAASGSKSRLISVPTPAVAVLAKLGYLPGLPFYPDLLARLRASKPTSSPEATIDLGFAPRPLVEGLAQLQGSKKAASRAGGA
jgi:nucleoside-diphosphate-sugar epimerase